MDGCRTCNSIWSWESLWTAEWRGSSVFREVVPSSGSLVSVVQYLSNWWVHITNFRMHNCNVEAIKCWNNIRNSWVMRHCWIVFLFSPNICLIVLLWSELLQKNNTFTIRWLHFTPLCVIYCNNYTTHHSLEICDALLFRLSSSALVPFLFLSPYCWPYNVDIR